MLARLLLDFEAAVRDFMDSLCRLRGVELLCDASLSKEASRMLRLSEQRDLGAFCQEPETIVGFRCM